MNGYAKTPDNAPLSGDEILAIHQGVELDDLQWTPDSSRIIFRNRFSGAPEFWSVCPDTRTLARLTVGSGGSTPRVSPDGRYLAYLSGRSGSKEVWLHPFAGPAADDRRLTNLGGDTNSAAWAPDGNSIVLSNNRYGSYDVYEVSVSSGEWKRLTSDPLRYEHYAVYTPDGKQIVYVALSENWEDHDIMILNRHMAKQSLIVTDKDLFDYQVGRRFGHPLISPSGRWMLFRSFRNNWIDYWKVDLSEQISSTGLRATPLFLEDHDQMAEAGSISCGEAAWSPDSRYVAFPSNHDGNVQLRIVEVETSRCVVVAAEEEGVASQPQWSPDGKHLAFIQQSFTEPPDVWVLDVSVNDGALVTANKRQLTFSMPQALARKFNRPEKVVYESFDGTPINAYVYLPPGGRSAPGPAIMEVHGGPVDQYRDTMHVVVQYYVQRGYVVLMPNIRGSAGCGKHFEELLKTGWSVDDMQDVICGARYLVEAGLADKDRIGVTGQSYGGAMTLKLATSAPQGMFQAVISRTGCADWAYYYRHGSESTSKLLHHHLGPLEGNEDVYRKSSAINFAFRTQTPLFVIGQADELGQPHPDRQDEFVAELRRFGKIVKYKKYQNTGGPYARHPSGAKEMLPDMMAFFKTYIG